MLHHNMPPELNLKALKQLILAYRDRDRAAGMEIRGGKVVGLLGSDVPEEPLSPPGACPCASVATSTPVMNIALAVI